MRCLPLPLVKERSNAAFFSFFYLLFHLLFSSQWRLGLPQLPQPSLFSSLSLFILFERRPIVSPAFTPPPSKASADGKGRNETSNGHLH